MEKKSDFLVIGSGIAGLTFALKVAQYGKVNLITKRDILESNTRYAQGGIASVWSQEDSFSKHISDTLIAGDGLCDEEIVEMTVKEGPGRIKDLIGWGVDFSLWEKDANKYDLTKEGGHSKRRILHAQDLTGEEVEDTLVEEVRKQKNINIFENHYAINLIVKNNRCVLF